jgi:hypothetical protein
MNKMLKGLLIAACAFGAVNAGNTTNKTFLLPRPQGVNLPMEETTFAELTMLEKEDRFGGNFQLVPFYQQSTSHADTAKYFLINNKSTITLRSGTNAGGLRSNTTGDLDINYLLHNYLAGTQGYTAESANFALDPEQTVYGVRIDYNQNMDKILRGLYLNINLPIVHVENKTEPTVSNASSTDLKTHLEQYLRGDYVVAENSTTEHNAQVKLDYAKIGGNQSDTGVADIDIALGYKFFNKEKYHGAIALGLTIPTGNEADGVHMFQPIIGNGKHFGLGADLCIGARMWGDVDHNGKIHIKMKYRYLFENSERRTLGIKNYSWGQYHLLVAANVLQTNATSLIPAANQTTLNVDVTPGSQFDGIIGFAYNNGGFTLDLGYNAYLRETEHVHLKDTFENGKWAIAARNYDTASGVASPHVTHDPINVTDDAAAIDGAAATAILTRDTLDTDAAATPSQFTNALYAGLGYNFKEWDTPLLLGLGGKYEFASKNSVLEQWDIYAKIGIGF